MQSNPEFDLHIWKQKAEGDRVERFTVGVWVDDRIMPLCHIQPIDDAVAVIRAALEQAGKPAVHARTAKAV